MAQSLSSLQKSEFFKVDDFILPFFGTNFFQLLMGLRSFQKSEFLKLIISLLHYFWHQNWDQWHKMSRKNTHLYFFYFSFKNKRVWAEKIRKKQKKSKKLKVAGNYPNIKFTLVIHFFLHEKTKSRFCHLSFWLQLVWLC